LTRDLNFDTVKSMELDVDKIKRIKEALGLSWNDIAVKGNLNSRQHAWDKYRRKSIKSAEFFGRIFNINPKDLIK
jgi:hypothetical protein